jgi:rhamnosyltransferase
MTICAVIVSYHPSNELLDNVAALRDQVDEIVIVDNGSGLATKTLLDQLRNDPKVSITYLPENLGIAAALNVGVKHAQSAGHEWLATFDQDSQASPKMIATMLQAYAQHPQKEQVASLSPRYQNQATGQIVTSRSKKAGDTSQPYIQVFEVITSGNLLKLSIFEKVGYFNESLFIDYVDTEFCLRCTLSGYQTLEIKSTYLLHQLGNSIHIKIFGQKKTVTNHSSLRRYYIARNATYLYKRWFFKDNEWVRHDSLKLLKTIAMVCFEREKIRKLSAITKGIIDGLFGTMGKFKGSI